MNHRPLLRSLLYVPGSNDRALEKACSLPADGVILDLEDAVAPGDKERARSAVCNAVARRGFGPRLVVVRINDPDSPVGKEDLRAVLEAGPDAVLVPKVETAADIVSLSLQMDEIDVKGKVEIWAMMETPMAILNAREIAALGAGRCPRLAALVLGANDLVALTRTVPAEQGPWLMACVLAARAHGLFVLDGVYNRYDDPEGLREDCRIARDRGMDGKTLIHPSQIGICNELFAPHPVELAQAREIVALFEREENRGASLLPLGGRMVERLHYEMALDTLRINRDIEKLDDQ